MTAERTLSEAVIDHYAKMMELSDEYIECEVCDHSERVYRWSMYKTAVDCLHLYYQLDGYFKPVSSVAVREAGHTGKGDESRLLDFGLLRKVTVYSPDGKASRSCYYQVTNLGRDYLRGIRSVPSNIWVFGKHNVIKESDERSYVSAASPSFELGKMMRNEF